MDPCLSIGYANLHRFLSQSVIYFEALTGIIQQYCELHSFLYFWLCVIKLIRFFFILGFIFTFGILILQFNFFYAYCLNYIFFLIIMEIYLYLKFMG